MTRSSVLTVFFLGFLFAAPAVQSEPIQPSFDCDQAAKGSVNELICKKSVLASLDAEVARLYRLANPGHEAIPFREQEDWLKARSDCLSQKAQDGCLKSFYLRRIAGLRAVYPAARGDDKNGISRGPIPYRCDKIDGILNAFFVRTEPALAYVEIQDRSYELQLVPAGSGNKYKGPGHASFFWTKGKDAIWRPDASQPETNCHEAAADPASVASDKDSNGPS